MSAQDFFGYQEPAPERAEPTETVGSFDVSEYLRLLRKRWPIIAAVTLVTTLLGATHYYITPKQYRASSILRLEQRSILATGSQPNPWLDAWASRFYYPTQYRLLRSRGLGERVAVELGLVRRDDYETEAEYEAALAGAGASLSGRLKVEPIAGTELVTLSYVASAPEEAARVVNTYADVFIGWAVETRTERVTEATQLLSRQVAALTAEIAERETQLQTRGQDLGVVVGLDSDEPPSTLTQSQLATLNEAYSGAIADRLERAARYQELRRTPDTQLAELRSTTLVDELRGEVRELETRYQQQLEVYKPEWPAMVELAEEIEAARAALDRVIGDEAQKIRQVASNELQAATRREEGLLRQIQDLKSEAISQTSAASEYQGVRTELSIRRDLLNRLMRELSDAGFSAGLSSSGRSNIQIVDRALVPGSAFRPSLRQDLTAGLSAGIVLGVGLVLLVHFLDRTVKSAEQLERLLRLPVLAVIPSLRGDRSYERYGGYGYAYRKKPSKGRSKKSDEPLQIELLPAVKPTLAISEAYRSLRTALLLSSAEELKVLTVTSATAGEGKTATSANLGVVMAQLGMRVLLVDADLRRSRQHKVFEISNRLGLVNLLTGTAQPEEVGQATSIPNLFVATAGPTPPNPSELLTSDRMAEFLDWARSHYDIVILDTPPVLAVTDAILAGSLSDGVLLCFRAAKAIRQDVRTCGNRLRRADVHIFGAILNHFEPVRGSSYGRQYEYYRSYEQTPAPDSAADSAA
ncbi:MAG: polysaccharide biosynthesis tyrosine autokinase [Thermoanaerobaculia bacterium]|nr:polysaccharide biosynthesis tyrosine autokinase [Thermoanaerobaculia bacterium]